MLMNTLCVYDREVHKTLAAFLPTHQVYFEYGFCITIRQTSSYSIKIQIVSQIETQKTKMMK